VSDGTTTRTFTLTAPQIAAGTVATSFPQPAEGATLTVNAFVTDVAGNRGASASDAALRDTIAPALTITAIDADTGVAGDFVTTDGTQVFVGTAPAGQRVTVVLDGVVLGTTVAADGGTWRYDHTATTLPSGQYTLEARATDVAGNTATVTRDFVVFGAQMDPTTDDGVSNTDLINVAAGRINVLVSLPSGQPGQWRSFMVTQSRTGGRVRPVRTNVLPPGTRMTVEVPEPPRTADDTQRTRTLAQELFGYYSEPRPVPSVVATDRGAPAAAAGRLDPETIARIHREFGRRLQRF